MREYCRPRHDHEPVPLVARHDHPKLLRGRGGGWMVGHVPTHDSSCSDFQNDKHGDDAEGGRDDDKEITASTTRAWFSTKVIPPCVPCLERDGCDAIYRRAVRGETRMPSLTRSSLAIGRSPKVRFAAAIVANSCCKSTGIGAGRRPRLPAPPQPESVSMPPNEGLRFHDGQQMPPVDRAMTRQRG